MNIALEYPNSVCYTRYMKHKLKCEVCGDIYESLQKTTKSCSRECANIRTSRITGRYAMINKENEIPTGTVGTMSELLVATDLMKKGYAVFRAMSPSCFCDLIAIKKEKVLKLEVRTAYKNLSTGNIIYSKKLHGDANCFGLYERNNGEIYYFDLSDNEIIC